MILRKQIFEGIRNFHAELVLSFLVKSNFSLLAALFVAATPLSISAQSTNAQPSPTPQEEEGGGYDPMAKLSRSERIQVKLAHDKAIQQSPELDEKIKAARLVMEEARKSMYKAMVEADPTVEPVLAKMMPHKLAKLEGGSGAVKKLIGGNAPVIAPPSTHSNGWSHVGHHEPLGMANLSEAERQHLKSLHEQVKSDPAVVAARQAKQSATTPQARNAAEEALHQAMQHAMIKADPSAEAILSKLHSDDDQGEGAPPPPPPPMDQ